MTIPATDSLQEVALGSTPTEVVLYRRPATAIWALAFATAMIPFSIYLAIAAPAGPWFGGTMPGGVSRLVGIFGGVAFTAAIPVLVREIAHGHAVAVELTPSSLRFHPQGSRRSREYPWDNIESARYRRGLMGGISLRAGGYRPLDLPKSWFVPRDWSTLVRTISTELTSRGASVDL